MSDAPARALPTPYFEDAHTGITIYCADNRDVLPLLEPASLHAVVTDPPYGLRFMGKKWDYAVPARETWQLIDRLLKPGAHLVSFFSTRTYHRGVIHIEDAGFEIRDQLAWVYGSGWPKSLDVSKAIDNAAGAARDVLPGKRHEGYNTKNGTTFGHSEALAAHWNSITAPATEAAKQWAGWGTGLKPAWECICLARKPLDGTVCDNVLQHSTGALNIDASKIGTDIVHSHHTAMLAHGGQNARPWHADHIDSTHAHRGRFPANLIHDGSPDVHEAFAQSREPNSDVGTAARFFFAAKASPAEREEGLGDLARAAGTTRRNTHATVKPLALMSWLIRLITPPGGIILDPFMGSGSTLVAAKELGVRCIGIEQNEYDCAVAVRRLRQLVLPFPSLPRALDKAVTMSDEPVLFGREREDAS